MLIIDGLTRIITVPAEDKLFGVTSDEKTQVKHFQCPRYTGNGLDLSTFSLRINYINAGHETDQYLVKDMKVNGDMIEFSWELSRHVTMYKGSIQFIVCAVRVDAQGLIQNEWNTTYAMGDVLQGIEVDGSSYDEETADAIEGILLKVNDRINTILSELPEDYQDLLAKLAAVKQDFTQLDDRLSESITEIRGELNEEFQYIPMLLDYEDKGFYQRGTWTANVGYDTKFFVVEPKSTLYATSYVNWAYNTVGMVVFFNNKTDKTYMSHFYPSDGVGDYVRFSVDIPDGCHYVAVVSKIDNASGHYYGEFCKLEDGKIVSDTMMRVTPKLKLKKSNDVIEITRPYSDRYVLRNTMRKCGSSNLLQLHDIYYDSIKDGVSSFVKDAHTDWVGPYKVQAINNPTANHGGAQYYTGGWHGANNGTNGYPVGETVEYKVIADGHEVDDTEKMYCNEIVVCVKNHICGNNTTDTTGGSDYRYVLQEEVFYTYNLDRCNVTVIITALEDIGIKEYYGLQIDGSRFKKRNYVIGSEVDIVEKNGTAISKTYEWIPDFFVAEDDDSNFAIAHTEKVGIGTEVKNVMTNPIRKGHVSNHKTYWDIVYNANYTDCTLRTGEKLLLKGWYKWLPYFNV